ncbi:MAG: hypothetical protein JXA38_03295 [Methanosarcinaceae archaeon]|nr:hypothetical protein [Methanosarcinaceae archaeon]
MSFFKGKKVNEILKEIDIEEVKKQEILAEIRSKRIQSNIAILTAIGTVIAFIVLNLSQIKEFFPKPKVKIQVEDQLILREGKVSVSKIEGNQNKKIVSCSAKEASEWLSLEPGSYNIVLQYQHQEIWSIDFLLESREYKVINIPSQFTGNIKVFVKNNTPTPLPEEMLDVKIDVTGNGYLWVYELTKEQRYSRVYPDPSLSKYDNAITVDKTFTFPDKNNLALFAETNETEETLLFVVTSQKKEDFADKIASRMTQIILKTSVQEKENNWGVAKITYHIKKP